MRRLVLFCAIVLFVWAPPSVAQNGQGKRINKAIDLLSQGQPIYYTGQEEGDYEAGKRLAQTTADYIDYNLEHGAFDIPKLRDFMRGLVDGGPTKSGHRTPAVIATLPVYAHSAEQMYANAWVVQQVLAAGVHGILLCNANDPEAVRVFVEVSRYPHAPLVAGLRESTITRGNGSQAFAARIWGMSGPEYMRKADPWPLSPDGEVLLGVKIENRHALANAEEILKIPGITFAEHGPGDMSLSFLGPPTGEPGDGARRNAHPSLVAARNRVLAATKAYNKFYLQSCDDETVIQKIKEGVMICTGGTQPHATKGREFTKRPQSW